MSTYYCFMLVFILFTYLFNLSTCCYMKRSVQVKQSNNKTETLSITQHQKQLRLIIPSTKLCNITTSSSKTPKYYCEHGGVCEYKLIYYNATHDSEEIRCICKKVSF